MIYSGILRPRLPWRQEYGIPAARLKRPPATTAHPVIAAQILPGSNLGVTRIVQQLLASRALIPAMLQQQPSAIVQMLAGIANNGRHMLQPIMPVG